MLDAAVLMMVVVALLKTVARIEVGAPMQLGFSWVLQRARPTLPEGFGPVATTARSRWRTRSHLQTADPLTSHQSHPISFVGLGARVAVVPDSLLPVVHHFLKARSMTYLVNTVWARCALTRS